MAAAPTFAGDVKVGSDYTAVSDLYNNDDTTKYGSWVDQRGVLVAARVNDSCLLLNQKGDSPSAYLARFQGKGVDVINFGNDGSATFAGNKIKFDSNGYGMFSRRGDGSYGDVRFNSADKGLTVANSSGTVVWSVDYSGNASF